MSHISTAIDQRQLCRHATSFWQNLLSLRQHCPVRRQYSQQSTVHLICCGNYAAIVSTTLVAASLYCLGSSLLTSPIHLLSPLPVLSLLPALPRLPVRLAPPPQFVPCLSSCFGFFQHGCD